MDPFGRMKVEWTNISKANVCPYLGREIPRYQELGLDAAKVYMLWRHPDELAKAAKTFDMVPVLDEHIVTDANNPEKEYVAGTTGTGTRFVYPYLQTPMALWVGDSIDDVKTRRKRQLSCGYGYRADMTAGVTPEGVAHDGIMRDIMANHVTLVREGRAGPDVLVADEQPDFLELPPMKRQSVVEAVVAALAGVTLTAEQTTALDVALDAAIGPLEVKAAADAKGAPKGAKEHGEACDCGAAGCGKAPAKDDTGKVGAVDPATGRAPEKGAPNPAAKDQKVDTVTKEQATQLANDAAAAAVKEALAAERALVAARADVADVVGNVALDSAEAVYRSALTTEKVDGAATIHASALPTVWAIHKAGKTARASVATDTKAVPSADARAAVAAIGL